jgi:hypothetical protein
VFDDALCTRLIPLDPCVVDVVDVVLDVDVLVVVVVGGGEPPPFSVVTPFLPTV